MIGIYLSGTGNTKHCVEKLLNFLDPDAVSLPLENPESAKMIEAEDTIILGCGLCSRECPMGNIEIKDNKAVSGNRCTMCYRCISLCPQKAITLLGDQVLEQCRYEKFE